MKKTILQITNILNQDSESVLTNQRDHGPMAEIDFWQFKAKNLNGEPQRVCEVTISFARKNYNISDMIKRNSN